METKEKRKYNSSNRAKGVQVSFSCPTDTYQELLERANQEGRSVSSLVAYLVHIYTST
jgi:methionyl-tRNA synthetase